MTNFPSGGFIRNADGTYLTKHNREINNCKNGIRAMVNMDFNTVDIGGERISNNVLNDLRFCNKLENRKKIRVKDKDEKASNISALDANVRLTLLGWINTKDIDRVEGVIAMGKEATILMARKHYGGIFF